MSLGVDLEASRAQSKPVSLSLLLPADLNVEFSPIKAPGLPACHHAQDMNWNLRALERVNAVLDHLHMTRLGF